jgi:hypothetical protein
VERGVKCCACFHAEKFTRLSVRREIAEMDGDEDKATSVGIATNKSHFPSPRVIFNDGTGAGILNQLDSCTRGLLLHEADTTMGSWNVLQSGPLDRSPGRIDPFRSTLMTLYEDPGSFTRLLKTEQINTEGSKLILLVSTQSLWTIQPSISINVQSARLLWPILTVDQR